MFHPKACSLNFHLSTYLALRVYKACRQRVESGAGRRRCTGRHTPARRTWTLVCTAGAALSVCRTSDISVRFSRLRSSLLWMPLDGSVDQHLHSSSYFNDFGFSGRSAVSGSVRQHGSNFTNESFQTHVQTLMLSLLILNVGIASPMTPIKVR